MKSSKRHVILLSLIFLLKCLSKSFFIRKKMATTINKGAQEKADQTENEDENEDELEDTADS